MTCMSYNETSFISPWNAFNEKVRKCPLCPNQPWQFLTPNTFIYGTIYFISNKWRGENRSIWGCRRKEGDYEGGGMQKLILQRERRFPEEEKSGGGETKVLNPEKKKIGHFSKTKRKALKRKLTSQWRDDSHTSRRRRTQNSNLESEDWRPETKPRGVDIGVNLGRGDLFPKWLGEARAIL